MPEFRRDPITGNQVIIAPGRAERPGAFSCPQPADASATASDCPFCPGNESATPSATATFYADEEAAKKVDTTNWSVRVVPNLYPAFDNNASNIETSDDGFFAHHAAGGHHEVVIESRRHVESLTQLSHLEAVQTFQAYRERFHAWQNDPQIVHPLAFKNCRPAAGASLYHAHSQLVGMRSILPVVERELSGSKAHFDRNGECVFCQTIERELAAKDRIVVADEDFVVVCPYASRTPYEMCVVPRQHSHDFTTTSRELIAGLARCVQDCLSRLEQVVPNVAYNYVLHSAPYLLESASYYHWHVEIIPRVAAARLAGFEWGTGCLINPLALSAPPACYRNDSTTCFRLKSLAKLVGLFR